MKNKINFQNSIAALGLIFILTLIITQIFNLEDKFHKNEIIIGSSTQGVCPPFNLLDEDGNIIDPVHNLNADKPYSSKQTCGAKGCHDYNKITEGFHFQQGKGELPNKTFKDRYQWVSTPGNYGGNWCSPAPIYKQLAKENNTNAKEIDMTSFEFITATCGYCHPGGGPMEFDRNGKRYDKWMGDSASNLKPGKDNNFNGDYFKSNWSNSGVLEADCMLCHLPEYDYKARNSQLDKQNFRWAATEGSTLAKVEGSIKDTIQIKIVYDLTKFDENGKLSMHLVREPRNETCLNCHAKPDWKKRGASFAARRDVHMNAGLKCVDCHSAGSRAFDEKIRGKEVHQFGKGDDPSGHVRDDLDNTVRTCESCHLTGYLNAPIAKHSWLPLLHLENIACQTCHINQRSVKAALVQTSDVFNKGPKILPQGKRIWTFYDENMNYWNHYGELNMFTAKDQPTDPFTPSLAKYKGKIYPVNMVHSSWPGIYTEGKSGLNQPKMKDIFEMWTSHNSDSTIYPLLSKIKDDNKDGVNEVNKEEEIDAFINSVTQHLSYKGYDLKEKKIVWVNNDRMYSNGKSFTMIPKEDYEASPYASVYKYSHDVSPAKAALGSNGCIDCHSFSSPVFFSQIVKYPFDEKGKSITEPQYSRLGISGFFAVLGALRESILKPVLYAEIGLILTLVIVWILFNYLKNSVIVNSIKYKDKIYYGIIGFSIISYTILIISTNLAPYLIPNRMLLDGNHFLVGLFILLVGLFIYLKEKSNILAVALIVSIISGFFMLIRFDFIDSIRRTAFTLYDLSLIAILLISTLEIIKHQLIKFNQIEYTIRND